MWPSLVIDLSLYMGSIPECMQCHRINAFGQDGKLSQIIIIVIYPYSDIYPLLPYVLQKRSCLVTKSHIHTYVCAYCNVIITQRSVNTAISSSSGNINIVLTASVFQTMAALTTSAGVL